MTAYVAFPSEVPELIIHGVQEIIDIRRVLPRFWPRTFLHWTSGEMSAYFEKEKISFWISWIEKSWERNRYYSKNSPMATGEWVYLRARGKDIAHTSRFLAEIAEKTNGFQTDQNAFKHDGRSWKVPSGDSPLHGVDHSKHRFMRMIGPQHARAIEAILCDGRNIIATHDLLLEEIGKTAYA
jgi:hypothetical protein